MYWEKKNRIPKSKGNLVIFTKKLIPRANINNNLKNKKSQWYFKNYRGRSCIYQKIKGDKWNLLKLKILLSGIERNWG